MNRTIFGVLASLMTICGTVSAAAEPAAIADEFLPGGSLDTAMREAALKSLYEDAVFEAAPLEVPTPDPELFEIWRGNKPELSAEIPTVELRLVRSVNGAEEEINLAVQISEKTIVVQSDSPGTSEVAGGVRMMLRPDRSTEYLMLGKPGRSLFLFVPRVANGATAVFLCPRSRSDAASSKVLTLSDSGFRLNRARFHATGSVRGHLLTARQIGYARAALAVSASLPPAAFLTDEVYARDPEVDARYSSAGKESDTLIDADQKAVGRIRAELDLHGISGVKRVSSLDRRLFVEGLEIPKEVEFVFKGSPAIAGAGSCVALVSTAERRDIYSREPFQQRTDE